MEGITTKIGASSRGLAKGMNMKNIGRLFG